MNSRKTSNAKYANLKYPAFDWPQLVRTSAGCCRRAAQISPQAYKKAKDRHDLTKRLVEEWRV